MLAALLQPPGEDLGARVAWIQALIVAVEGEDLGDVGASVALDLKASLGAIVAWGRGPRDAESLLHLQALLTALLRRSSSTLYRVLAQHWRALENDDIARAFDDAAVTVEAGADVPADVSARLSAIAGNDS